MTFGIGIIFAAALFGKSVNAPLPKPVPSKQTYDLDGIKLTVPPTINGEFAPGEWPEAARREGFFDGDTNLPSDEQGEFWLAYTDEAIYLAARFRTNPGRIVSDEYRPNVNLRGNDNVSLRIDPFGDGNNFSTFSTNARGATQIELAGGRAAKTEWLGEFEAEGKVTETGWQCEMRIPWSVLSLPPQGKRDIKFNIGWYRSNKQNSYTYRYTNRDSRLTPVWKGIEIPATLTAKTIKLLPYITGGVAEGQPPIFNSGFDLKTELTESLTLVGTVNPDFDNIENSILSLDFSYFERLADEGRPFFQEGSQYLRTGFDSRMFAPQRVRNVDTGLNVYGQIDSKTSLGAITAVDIGEQTATAFSISHRPKPNNSIQFAYVGNQQVGKNNDALLLNYFDRIGSQSFFFNNQFTDDDVDGSGWRNNLGFMLNGPGIRGNVEYIQISPKYRPRLGFSPERNLKGFSGNFRKEHTPTGGPFTAFSYGVGGLTYDRYDGGFYRNNFRASFDARLRNRLTIELDANYSNFEGSSDFTHGVEIGFPAGDPYRNISLEWTGGRFLGKDYESYGLRASYKPTFRSQLNLRSQWVEFDGFEQQHILSFRYDLSKFESVGGRLVYENEEWNWYLSYRMSGKRGAEYFVLVGDPNAESFQNRLVFKAVFPLSIRY